jgi:hypothetical protein
LKVDIEKKEKIVEEYEQKAKDSKCGVWDAIFSLGLSCLSFHIRANRIRDIKRDWEKELSIVQSLSDKMFYFDGIVNVAKHFNSEASLLLETTKVLSNSLGDTKTVLEEEYTDDEIIDNLFDEDFANEFASTLHASFKELTDTCDEVIADCEARKKLLTDAIIWGQ